MKTPRCPQKLVGRSELRNARKVANVRKAGIGDEKQRRQSQRFQSERSKRPNETQAQPRLRQAQVAADFGTLAEIDMKS